MNPRILSLIALLGVTWSGLLPAQEASGPAVLKISADKAAAKFSPMLYGLMTEEINYSYDGGLYAELVRNRTFRDNATNPVHWRMTGNTDASSMSFDETQPMNDVLTRSLKFEVGKADADNPVGIANEGYWGIPLQPDTRYRASFYVRAAAGFTGPLTVSLVNANDHSLVRASAQVKQISDKWQKYEVTLSTGKINPSKDNLLVISTANPGTIWFNLVSLFPPTFNNRPNGNRPDLMQLLGDMKPAFLRFPGGNYLEGNTVATRYNWKTTIGDISERPGHFDDAWGYWSSDGLGLLEFLEWCEDLHMEPLLAVYGGYSMRQGAVNLENELDSHVQDALDEIEYVTGDTTTKWGARRAKDGHKAPFKLQYVEVGNEDNLGSGGRTYDARFTKFYDAIKAKHPQLKVISTCPSSTSIVTSRVPDVVDDHYYNPPLAMQRRAGQYDNYDRSKPKVFVGEYASQTPNPNRQVTPCLGDAIGDAAFLTGLERNSDVVIMASYAPLLVNVSNPNASGGRNNPNRSMQWPTDLVGYDAIGSFGSPSYYAQSIFSQNHGDEVLATSAENFPQQEGPVQGGRRGAAADTNQPPPRAPMIPSLFYSVSRDSKSGVIYLKVVNGVGKAQPLNVKISGAAIQPDAKQIVIAGDGPLATNSIKDPAKIVPVTSEVHGLSADFTREFPPYSITVLLLKGK